MVTLSMAVVSSTTDLYYGEWNLREVSCKCELGKELEIVLSIQHDLNLVYKTIWVMKSQKTQRAIMIFMIYLSCTSDANN